MKHLYTRIGIRVVLIMSMLAFLSFAYMVRSDTAGITFATGSGQGGLEMKIDSRTIYNGVIQPKLTWALKHLIPFCDFFFKFLDVKPGDTGLNTISIHIEKNPAWVCLDFVNLKDEENGVNEPESHVDANGTKGGELSSGLEFFAWMDDGDNKYEVGERALFGTTTQAATTTLRDKTYALADAKHGTAFPANSTRYVGISWCAGDLKVSTTTAVITCNGATLGNGAQTDSMKVDVSLRAVSSSDQKTFLCTPTPKPTCDSSKGKDTKGDDKDKKGGNGKGSNDDCDDGHDDSNNGGGKDDGHGGEVDGWHETKSDDGFHKIVKACKSVINKFRS